jgi:hypothetical protein
MQLSALAVKKFFSLFWYSRRNSTAKYIKQQIFDDLKALKAL